MNCPNCGTSNNISSKFCVGCGSRLQTQSTQSVVQEKNVSKQQKITSKLNNKFLNDILSLFVGIIIKPDDTLKEEKNKFNDLKTSAIFSLIIAGVATIISLIRTMINTVRVTSFFSSEVKWVWENLKNIDYIKVIGTTFIKYALIIILIAAVYYLASLIIKKQLNFSNLIGVSAVAIVPALACSLVVSPILGMIYSPLSLITMLVGLIYTIIILYEYLNSELSLNGNTKILFNSICLTVIAIGLGIISVNFTVTTISSDLGSILNFIK